MCIRDRIDTGANVSIINTTELERIQGNCGKLLPTLPINNIALIGATGRQNKTIRKQVSLNVVSKGIATVSYTHLDVYKRQTVHCVQINVFNFNGKFVDSLRPICFICLHTHI